MINLNGNILKQEAAGISPFNRGLHYGDAVFETMKLSAGKLFFWEDHYFRLMASMRIMRMEIPMIFTPEFLHDEVMNLLDEQEDTSKSYRVKLLVWRAWGGTYLSTSEDVEYAIFMERMEQPFYLLSKENYEIELYKDHYVTSGLLSTLKHNNKAIHVLGSRYASENDYQNCLILNEKKQVVEALNGNVFLVNGYKVKTPPILDGCLNGILRKQLFKIFAEMPDYILEEASVSPFELQKADEIFITNTIVGVQPVTKFRKKEYQTAVAEELVAKLNVHARLG